jgi:hypothetical protein
MGSGVLALDNVLSAAHFFVGKWTPELKRNQSRDVLRHLLCRMYGVSKGNPFHATLRTSHTSIAAAVDLSREWTCKLLARIRTEGWLTYYAPRLPDGHFEVGVFRPGRRLKRLLCMLAGYRRKSKPSSRVNSSSQFLPLSDSEREKVLSSLKKLRTDLSQRLKAGEMDQAPYSLNRSAERKQ